MNPLPSQICRSSDPIGLESESTRGWLTMAKRMRREGPSAPVIPEEVHSTVNMSMSQLSSALDVGVFMPSSTGFTFHLFSSVFISEFCPFMNEIR